MFAPVQAEILADIEYTMSAPSGDNDDDHDVIDFVSRQRKPQELRSLGMALAHAVNGDMFAEDHSKRSSADMNSDRGVRRWTVDEFLHLLDTVWVDQVEHGAVILAAASCYVSVRSNTSSPTTTTMRVVIDSVPPRPGAHEPAAVQPAPYAQQAD